MKYNLEGICSRFNKNEELEFMFFWGHRKNKKGTITKSCFSQWYQLDFEVDGILYNCAEQYMMAEKARLFRDYEVLEKILLETEQSEIKKLGRAIKNFDEELWNNEKYNIVLRGNLAKFAQHEELKKFLISTANKVIVEASPYDIVWGIGMSVDHKDIDNPMVWKGENLLGFALMEVRDLINV